MINAATISDKKALDFYFEILSEVDIRVGRAPSKDKSLSRTQLNRILNENKRILLQPKESIHKYKIAKIASMLCVEFGNLGIF